MNGYANHDRERQPTEHNRYQLQVLGFLYVEEGERPKNTDEHYQTQPVDVESRQRTVFPATKSNIVVVRCVGGMIVGTEKQELVVCRQKN